MKELFKDTPVTVIDMMSYGTMNGEKVLEDALKLLKGE
jgi:cellobiose PTS system EIIB component